MIMTLAKFYDLNSGILVDATLDYGKSKVRSYTDVDNKKSMVAVIKPNEPLEVCESLNKDDSLVYRVVPPTELISTIINCEHFHLPMYFTKQDDGSYIVAHRQQFQRQPLTNLFQTFLDSYMRWFNEKSKVNQR